MRNRLLFLLAIIFVVGTASKCTDAKSNTEEEKKNVISEDKDLEDYTVAYFASGCFWCVEAVFESVKGVEEAISGYAGGNDKNPTYQKVSAGLTDHAEAVAVYYDTSKIDFETLVKVYYGSHDPTTLNRQGPDSGTQYRSIAFYTNEEEKAIIENYIAVLEANNVYNNPIVTEVKPLETFYEAEAYHQDFEERNPNQPYVRAVSVPRLNKFKQKFPALLKDNH